MGGGCLGASGGMGGCHHMHAHAHACTHMHTRTCIHVWKLQMAANMEASMFSMFNMHVHACVHVCVHACVHGTPPHTRTYPYPHPTICHPPSGGPPESVKIQKHLN